jgi:hypothetical protein
MSPAWHERKGPVLIVSNEVAKRGILSMLGDDLSTKILAATNQTSMSLLRMSQQLGVSLGDLDRKLGELLDIGLMAATKSAGSESGLVYRSVLDQVMVRFEYEGVNVDVAINSHVSSKTAGKLLHVTRSSGA